MLSTRTCIDVDDLERGVAFYTGALGLEVKGRFENAWVTLGGAGNPIDLVQHDAESTPTGDPTIRRRYERHWTPVHLDFVVDQLDAVVARCVAHGARLEHPAAEKPWGRIAILSDPFGHGFCVLEFKGRGYDEVLNPL